MSRSSLAFLALTWAAACGGAPEAPGLGEPSSSSEGSPTGSAAEPPPSTSPMPRCQLPLETGPCDAAFPRYGFDPALDRCREFLWGGCEGNENRFESFEACRTACGGDEVEARACGGSAGPTCTADEFCDFPQDGCDTANGEGVCRPRPDGCFLIYDPVCGCDGRTHGNECAAHVEGTDVARKGVCEGS
ncbi:MAG: BPTI/Kunitz-type proteinase inhibitor domain-containing protein [Myxococcota bacterium]